MKKIYEFPEVTIFNVGPAEHMLTISGGEVVGTTVGYNDEGYENGFTNSNSFDDQSTPWYRR